ncbi:MAG: hypothetical protein U1E53_04010 [Dongiaceae bacterium]
MAERRSPGRVLRLARLGPRRSADGVRLWYRFAGEPLPPRLDLLDGFVLAFLFAAMRRGRDLRVRGPVSRALLANLRELQEVWCRWRPDALVPVEILPDRVVDAPPAAAGGIACVSGGVDSLATLQRHRAGGLRPLRAGLLVAGFDIPLADAAGFRRAEHGVRAVLDSIGLPLATVATNWRDVACGDWELEHGAALAACLAQFAGLAACGLIAADLPVDLPHPPWGNNPVTTPLLSGALAIVHDGAGLTRPDKAALIAGWPAALRHLRVCWQGEARDGNCGRCEKCIRTQLSFLAIGRPIPPAFPHPFAPADLLRLAMPRMAVLLAYRQLLATAERHGVEADWTRTLRWVLRRNLVTLPLQPALGAARRRLRRVGWLKALHDRRRAGHRLAALPSAAAGRR